jgi:glycosyltransferase involved in cell wall biosynthesis
MKSIGYLITVYNEVKTVQKSIDDVLKIKYPKKKIIIIDNGSNDGSAEIIKKYKDPLIKKVLRKKNIGFGKSIEKGINSLDTDYIYIQYSDLEYDHHRSIDMLNYAIVNNLDVVLGSRLTTSIMKNKNIYEILKFKPSYLATIICTFLINKFYNKKFTDIIGGKLYKRKTIKRIPINCYTHGFDFEFISRILKKKLKVGEISIKYKPRQNSSEKKIKPYHIINALYEIFKVKFFDKR